MDAAQRREIRVSLALGTGAAVALGFSRFAYALLLPPMREDLAWSYVQAGAMNTANGAGYIAGALASAFVAEHFGIGRAFLAGIAGSALALLLSGLTGDFHALVALRTVGGAMTAFAFILGASLASAVASRPERAGHMVALYIAGAGGGIVVSGFLLPPLLAALGPPGWRAGWLAMAALSFLALVPAALAVRRTPAAGLRQPGRLPPRVARGLMPTFAGYALFGGGYVSYMTFIIVLVRQAGGGAWATSSYWVLLGASSIAGTFLWSRLLGIASAGLGPGLASGALALGALPVLIWPGLPAAYVSAVLFGGTFMAVPMAITMLARRLLPLELATAAISALTVTFALGQAAGPIVSGYVTDLTGSIAAGLWVAPLLLAGAALLSL
ncbi:YbfB/YjiJ family MFS transporter, partial [Amaricoccus sp.]|uniref:YbfB/YjiJ family MFS transporter n=1 Tax=Amaricoccus sp. TaxID=1872485 RepID=UPI00262AA171